MKKSKVARKNITIVYLLLIFGSIIMILPFVWTVLTSLKSFTEAVAIPPTIIPKTFQVSNYTQAITQVKFGKLYLNTAIMVAVRTAGAVLFSTMAAYAFARIEFPFKKILFALVLLQMMVPGQIYIIPQYLLMVKLGWLNSIKALIAPGIVSAFGTFLMRQFFMSLPKELEEAAFLDGCNRWQIYWKIMLPLAKSGMVALGIFTALFAWKDLLWPLIVNMSLDKMTLSAGLAALRGQFSTNYPVLMAGSVIAIVPMIILFIIFQRHFIQGIASTGSKS